MGVAKDRKEGGAVEVVRFWRKVGAFYVTSAAMDDEAGNVGRLFRGGMGGKGGDVRYHCLCRRMLLQQY